MLFNSLCSELAFCAAVGGAVRRVAAPYNGLQKAKLRLIFVLCMIIYWWVINMALPDRKPNRLKNFSYSSAGAYFITICIAGRAKILCDIVGGGDLDAPEVNLTDEGQIILKYIIGFEKVKGAHIDNFVIMPNHIHMIIRIDEADISSTRANEKIPRMVAAFKRFCNAEIGRDIFQRTYFDRVIRDEHDYEMIWEYIETNPAKWENDCFR